MRLSVALDPDRARAHAGMGDVLTAEHQWSEAEAHFARAVELDEDDPLNQLDFGEYWHARAAGTEDAAQRSNLLRRARRRYVKANELDDSRPWTYAAYGASFLAEGEDASQGVETLEHAEKLLPSNPQIRFWLARVYARVGRREDARRLLRRLVHWDHGQGYAEAAQALLDALDADADAADSPAPPSGVDLTQPAMSR